MTVEEILASGTYTDRRGRVWEVFGQEGDLGIGWGYWEQPFGIQAVIGTHHLRTIIERDMHRDECDGLIDCGDHPTWIVSQGFNEDGPLGWEILRPYKNQGRLLDVTHAEAMNAAYRLAVGE